MKDGEQAMAIIKNLEDLGVTMNNIHIGVKLKVDVKSQTHSTFPPQQRNTSHLQLQQPPSRRRFINFL